MIRSLSILVVSVIVSLPAEVFAECANVSDTLKSGSMKVSGGFMARVGAVLIKLSSDECGSLSSILGLITEGSRTGGRRLEAPKPFDEAAARASLQKAMEDPEVKAQFEKARAEIGDDTERALYEAVILDAYGHYDARDLRIQELKKAAQQS